MHPIPVSPVTLRRFILGKAGLWPGRRWHGREGAAAAIEALGLLQIDPINVFARSHDLTLWGRVRAYQPAHLEAVAYGERRFFDYGELLCFFPMRDLPYMRSVMRRTVARPRVAARMAEHAEAVAFVRARIAENGPMANRDFEGTARVSSYRARKDTGLALYTLWLAGELMTYGRRSFDRLYGLASAIVPPEHDWEAGAAEADDYFARRVIGIMAAPTLTEWGTRTSIIVDRRLDAPERTRRFHALREAGAVVPIAVEGVKGPAGQRFIAAEDAADLEQVAMGGIPEAWKPLSPDAPPEAVFLAPLDMVSARGRALPLFNFAYTWDVYKPAHLRPYGYYTLPILLGDRLIGRIDPKLDRTTGVFAVNGLWFEAAAAPDASTAAAVSEASVLEAVGRALGSLARFSGARALDLAAVTAGWRRPLLKAAGASAKGVLV
jgi:hypothetical protein